MISFSILRETVKCITVNQENLDTEEEKIRKLQSDLERKKELKKQQDQKFAKAVLNARKQRETLMEVRKMIQRYSPPPSRYIFYLIR